LDYRLLCGAAVVDITPHPFIPGIFLAGFESNRRAKALLDPLEAVAVTLSDGHSHVALVAVDLIGLPRPFVEWVRDLLVPDYPQPWNVLVCATHTHAGPDTIGLWGRAVLGKIPIESGVCEEYQRDLLHRIAEAVRRAYGAMVPVSVRAARFDVPSYWTRNDRKGGGKDDFGHVLAFDALDDSRRVATIVNFAAHPETLWEGNPFVSSDYPGEVRRRMTALTGGHCAFFSGALGGMVTPNVPLASTLKERQVAMRELGAGIAERASDALSNSRPLSDVRLSVARQPIALPLANRGFAMLKRLGILDREFVLGRLRTEMNAVTMGDKVSIMTAPGECTPEVGREVVARGPGEYRLLFCLGCDELGYILTEEQYQNPEYAYEKTMSVGPKTAPALLEAADRLRMRVATRSPDRPDWRSPG